MTLKTENFKTTTDLGNPAMLDFGDYCLIEHNRYWCDNEHYRYKVVGRLKSNTWVDVPVMHNAFETMHDHTEDVVACVCCSVNEREILRYRLADCRKHGSNLVVCQCISNGVIRQSTGIICDKCEFKKLIADGT